MAGMRDMAAKDRATLLACIKCTKLVCSNLQALIWEEGSGELSELLNLEHVRVEMKSAHDALLFEGQ
jgi:hypothetical protein